MPIKNLKTKQNKPGTEITNREHCLSFQQGSDIQPLGEQMLTRPNLTHLCSQAASAWLQDTSS